MCQGTGGTITGTAKYLKQMNPELKVYISEPLESPMLSRGAIGQHQVQGIADGLLPIILNLDYVDGIILVSSQDSIDMAKEIAAQEGIFCGISSGCNVGAAKKVAHRHPDKKCIVTMINDNGLRYLSTALCGSQEERTLLDREYKLSQEDQDKLAQYSFEIIE